MVQTSPTVFTELSCTTLSISGVDVVTAVLLAEGESADLNGEKLIIDADADTYIQQTGGAAGTDDSFGIVVAGAEDFRITANTLTALSGSSIATNTIAETTAGSGVTADSVLLKDGVVKSVPVTVTADGAIAIPPGDTTYFITKAGVAAMTIAAPTATTHDGIRLTFISTTAQAHTLDMASSGINGGSADIGTFGGAAGDGVTIVAYQAHWYEVPGSNANVTFA
jgi:hypothetical protein